MFGIQKRLAALFIALLSVFGVSLIAPQAAHADTYTWTAWRTCRFITDAGTVLGTAEYRVNVQYNSNNSQNRIFALGYKAVSTTINYVSAKDYDRTSGDAVGWGQGYGHTISPGQTWYPGATTSSQFGWRTPNKTSLQIGMRSSSGTWGWCYASMTH
jgi:hypothetical protein